jgi:hypothetical protein
LSRCDVLDWFEEAGGEGSAPGVTPSTVPYVPGLPCAPEVLSAWTVLFSGVGRAEVSGAGSVVVSSLGSVRAAVGGEGVAPGLCPPPAPEVLSAWTVLFSGVGRAEVSGAGPVVVSSIGSVSVVPGEGVVFAPGSTVSKSVSARSSWLGGVIGVCESLCGCASAAFGTARGPVAVPGFLRV